MTKTFAMTELPSLWWLGSLGLVAIEASYVPQITRLARLKRADEVSYFFPGLNAGGRVLALVYSVASHQHVFVAGFVLGIALRAILLGQVAWYRRVRSNVAPSVADAEAAS